MTKQCRAGKSRVEVTTEEQDENECIILQQIFTGNQIINIIPATNLVIQTAIN
jgi:hypothetical protein